MTEEELLENNKESDQQQMEMNVTGSFTRFSNDQNRKKKQKYQKYKWLFVC